MTCFLLSHLHHSKFVFIHEKDIYFLFSSFLPFPYLPKKNKNEVNTLPIKALDNVRISALARLRLPSYLLVVENVQVYSGKKATTMVINASSGNRAANLARMLFAPILGLTIWEMDGAGTQINIGSRGTRYAPFH